MGAVLNYIAKPLDLVTAYRHGASRLAGDPEGFLHLNGAVDHFLDGHCCFTEGRHQLEYFGVLDRRTKRRFIGSPP
jgi:hypothetical protein